MGDPRHLFDREKAVAETAALSFWARNRDRIIATAIAGAVGFVVGATFGAWGF